MAKKNTFIHMACFSLICHAKIYYILPWQKYFYAHGKFYFGFAMTIFTLFFAMVKLFNKHRWYHKRMWIHASILSTANLFGWRSSCHAYKHKKKDELCLKKKMSWLESYWHTLFPCCRTKLFSKLWLLKQYKKHKNQTGCMF